MKPIYLLLLCLIIIFTRCSNKESIVTPSVTFSLKSPNAYINEVVSFNLATTSGTTYAWDFGDGTAPANGTLATHTFTQSGIFTVTVKAATSSFSKKIRIYPGTCSFQFKNSFTRSLTAPAVDIYDSSNKELIPAKLTLSDLAPGAATDTIFVNLPVLNYKPNITLGLNFKNANNKNISFSSSSFVVPSGHSVCEITGNLSGTYFYGTTAGSFTSGNNTLTYTDNINW